jgi:hypothetical protein
MAVVYSSGCDIPWPTEVELEVLLDSCVIVVGKLKVETVEVVGSKMGEVVIAEVLVSSEGELTTPLSSVVLLELGPAGKGPLDVAIGTCTVAVVTGSYIRTEEFFVLDIVELLNEPVFVDCADSSTVRSSE